MGMRTDKSSRFTAEVIGVSNSRADREHIDVGIFKLTPLFTSIPSACNNMATISVWPFFAAKTRGGCRIKQMTDK